MMHSETVGQIAKALSLAQSDFKPIKRESVNPYFKSRYADLAAIIEGTKDALTKHGLAVSQLIQPSDGHVAIETMLLHESGEWLSSVIQLKPKADDPQSMGSAITYAKRYALGAILCVASEDDDDGNAATKQEKATTEPQKKQQPLISDPDSPITDPQVKAINTILGKTGIQDEYLRHKKVSDLLGLEAVITSISKLTKGQASTVIDKLGKGE